jgi:tetratricopeptide (TPR) repeat protein
LREAYHRLFAERQPRLLTLIGEMGLGKSRLLQEFIAWTDLRLEDWFLFQGRSLPSQVATPYALLRDIFSFRFEIQDSDTLAAVVEKMEQGFARFMPEDDRSQESAHIVGQLIGFDFSSSPYLRGLRLDPKQIRSLGFAILTRFFASAAAQMPVILLLDDLHWADQGSLEFLLSLLENLPAGTPLLVLGMARPALLERFPDWGQGLEGAARFELKPLTREDSRALVEQILQKAAEIPVSLREMIVDGADGNPFYLEELIKMLIDGKVIRPEAEKWEIDLARLQTVSVPPTLAGVLQARLDRLDANERASLQRASVVGRVFWNSAVEALGADLEVEHGQLEESLSVLRSKELIFPAPVTTFTGTQEYSFKHVLLRDVTYETVLKRQRTRYHALAADWLSQVSGERRGEYLPVIAEHYEKAGEAAKAVRVLLEAGERALGVSAFGEALRFFQRALSLLSPEQTRDLAFVHLKIGECFFRSGEFSVSLASTEKALFLARGFSTADFLAAVLYQIGQLHAEMGEYPSAEQSFLQALPTARAAGPAAAATLARLLYGLGNVYWRMGELEKALRFCTESRDLAARLDDPQTLMLALNRLGVVSGLLGDAESEERFYHQVLSLATTVGNRERAAVALNNLGALADEHHDLAKAKDFYLQALAVAREIGARQSQALYLINLGHCEIGLGQLDAALGYLREGLSLAEAHGAAPWTLIAVLFFALLAQARGETGRAFALFGLVRRQPAFSPDHQRLMDQALAEWGVGEVEASQRMSAGADLDWKQVVLQLMAA